jgi:folate-binding protein YgfZ
MRTAEVAEQIEALRSGRAHVDLSEWRKVRATGSEAEAWLNDLLSAELSGLAVGATRRSLLLSPTGRIRADVTVAATDAGTMLLQDPIQPRAIDRLLDPYVLSSDVELSDVTDEFTLIAVPGAEEDPAGIPGAQPLRPSCLGAGIDLLAPIDRSSEVRRALSNLVEAGPAAVEAWRIERGAGRFGIDLGDASLPQEAGLDGAVAYQKGCFLGQEAVARIRNLGHPPFVMLAAHGDGPISAGEKVLAGDDDVGIVTSAVTFDDGRAAAIVRVRWAARDRKLRTEAGTALGARDPASGSA